MSHPMQPIITDKYGIKRFKKNEIVDYLVRHGNIDLNTIATDSFSKEDKEQLAQLIGYSVVVFSDLSFVSKESIAIANTVSD